MMFHNARSMLPFFMKSEEEAGLMPSTISPAEDDDNMRPCIKMITGKMNSGKTRFIIEETISNLPLGSRVLYVVGRVHLAEELVARINDNTNSSVKAIRKPHLEDVPKNEIVVQVAVINSIQKYTLPCSVFIIDEMETTLKNLCMEAVDENEVGEIINKMSQEADTCLLVDAMFTTAGAMFAHFLGKAFAKKPVVKKEIHREGVNSARTIIPCTNDLSYIRLYTELFKSKPVDVGGDKGFIVRLLHTLHQEDKRVAVAVPTKTWGNFIEELVPESKTCLKIDGTNNHHKQSWKVDVLIYTSTISAGHSIDYEDHFDYVFVVVGGVTASGTWVTPSITEMAQMAARVRYPKTDKIYLTVDMCHPGLRNLVHTNTLKLSDNLHLDSFLGANEILAKKLAKLSKYEYTHLVTQLFARYAFPNSVVMEEPLSQVNVDSTIFKNLGKLHRNTEHAELLEFIHNHPEAASHFIHTPNLKRKRVPLEAFDEFPNLKRRKVGEDEYVLVL